jgi:hypothetical protein
MSLADWLLKERTPRELAKELAAKAHENAALKNRVHALEYELFWKTEAMTMNDTTHTAAHPAPAGIDLDPQTEIARIAKYWEDQARRGCVDALQCALKEAWDSALARKAALDAPAADERAQFEAWAQREDFWMAAALQRDHGGEYVDEDVHAHWVTWQARASIAHPIGQVSPAIGQADDSEIAPADIVIDLREYASNPGYSHNDYADTMRQAANCIESMRAMFWNYAAAPTSAVSPSDYTVDDSELARKIMVFIGRHTTQSMEPGADPLRDRLAERLAQWRPAISPSDEKGKADDASAGGLPSGVTLRAFQAADDKKWCITIQHPFGTSWVRMGDLRDVQLAELIAASPATSAADAKDATHEAIQRACRDLPEHYEISIDLERGAGCVLWRHRGGDWHAIDGEGYISDDIIEALDRAAIAASRKGGE